MNYSKQEDMKLKLANLFLAISLATVPTAITYLTLGIHGSNICRTLSSQVEIDKKEGIQDLCQEAAWDTTKSYIILIGFFITLPTWFWFYISMRRKKSLPHN